MNGHPLWISHRGFKETAVENTAAAFRTAVDLGFTCLETDLRLTRDNRIALIHDPTLKRLTGDRRRVSDMTASELTRIRFRQADKIKNGMKTKRHRIIDSEAARAHQAGSMPDNKGSASGDRILFIDEFVEEFSRCRWVFDIKPENGDETIRALLRWAEAVGMIDNIIQNAKILTWRADHEALAADRFPGVSFYARRAECWRAGLAMLFGKPGFGAIRPGRTYALPPTFMGVSLFQKSMVRRFHELNAAVVAFLPETDALARLAVAAGFDEILTNGKKGGN